MLRVLLDEDVPVPLRHDFEEGVHAETIEFRGWKSLDNGNLLRAAAREYDVLVTLDKNLPDQQNIESFDVGVVVLCGKDVRLPALQELMPEANEAIRRIGKGELLKIFPG